MNELLYKAAMEAINKLFCDQSVSPETTKENLNTLKDEIDMLLDSMEGH